MPFIFIPVSPIEHPRLGAHPADLEQAGEITEGGRLMAGVTPAAVRELNLREGAPVWCLFKAVALKARANA